MSTPEPEFLPTLDVTDEEFDTAPPAPEPEAEPAPAAEPAAAAPAPAPAAPRDPATGQFLAQPPASMPDPVKAAEAPKAEEPEQRVIPLAAHLEERRQLRAEIAKLHDRLAKIETPPKAEEPPPDFIEDPKGYVDAGLKRIEKTAEEVKQVAEVGAQQAQLQQFLEHVGAIEAQFVQSNPDYYDALGHIRAARTEQLREMFPDATPEQIGQQLRTEELQAASMLLQQGRNPSEVIYRQAQKVYGYQRKAAQPAAAAAAAPTVAAVPPIPRAPVGDPASTLGSSSGGAPSDAEADEVAPDDMNDMLSVALRERFKR